MQATNIPIVELFPNLVPGLKTNAINLGSITVGRPKKNVKSNIFVDDQFHFIEVAEPNAYADNFWSTSHGMHPRCYHRMNQKVFAALLCELKLVQNQSDAGSLNTNNFKVLSERFFLIDEKVGKEYRNDKLAGLVHKHPKFPVPSINWELVCR